MTKMMTAMATLTAAICIQGATMEPVSLPAPDKEGGMPLMKALTLRKTQRNFVPTEIDKQTLSNLLYAAWGINRPDGRRTVATARNLQDMLIYVALPSGTYLYNAEKNCLDPVLPKDIRGSCYRSPEMPESAGAVLIFVSDTNKYSDAHGKSFYQAVHAGTVSHSVYLYCTSAGLATVVCGAIDSESIAKILNLKPGFRVLLTQIVGHAAETPTAK